MSKLADLAPLLGWMGDPRPGTCGTHPQHLYTARDVDDMSPVRTLVKNPTPSKSDTDKPEGTDGKYPTRGLPHPWSRSKSLGPPVLNTPGESGSNSDGNIHEDKARTKGTPGKRSPVPDSPARVGPVRRPGMTADVVEADLFEGMDPAMISAIVRLAGMFPPAYPSGKTRHRKQYGQAYRYFHKRYQRQRGRIIQRQKRRHKRLKSNPRYTRDRERRKKNPERFLTKPSGGAKSLADRGEKQRAKKAFEPIPFYFYAKEQWGWILEVSPLETVHYEMDGRRYTADLDTFFDEVVVDEDRLDDLEAYLDEVFEYEPGEGENAEDTEDVDPLFDAWVSGRTAFQVHQRPVRRRHRQRGQARRKTRMYYMQNRAAIRRRSQVQYRKLRNNPTFKRQQQIRRQHPERFKMRLGLMLTTPDIAFVFITEEGLQRGYVHNVTGMSHQVLYWLDVPGHQMLQMMPVKNFLLNAVFLSDEDIDKMYTLVDAEIGLEAYDFDAVEDVPETVEETVERLAGQVVADFFREQRPPDMADDTKYDRADNHEEWRRKDRKRLEDFSEYDSTNEGNPGSKVLPSGAGHVEKEAALISDIREGCAPDLTAKARGLKVSLRRVDAKNTMWLFDVQGSKEPYRIRLQAVRKGNVRALAKAHVRVSCSCLFWQWQGPEHWAKQGDYLFGRPVGLATKPNIKDPKGEHRACKHVLAVLDYVTSRKWYLPASQSKQGSLRFLADTLDQDKVFMLAILNQRIERVAARYFASQKEMYVA